MAELTLEIVEGPGAGRVAALGSVVEIGTDPTAGLCVEDTHVEPRHVRVTPSGDGALVEDLGEPGGTFVNDAELHAPTRINPGDEIQVGITVLRLRASSDPSAARTTPPPLAVTPAPMGYIPAAAVAGQAPEAPHPEMQELLDVRVKGKARHAPLAVFVIVVYAVLIYLATAKF